MRHKSERQPKAAMSPPGRPAMGRHGRLACALRRSGRVSSYLEIRKPLSTARKPTNCGPRSFAASASGFAAIDADRLVVCLAIAELERYPSGKGRLPGSNFACDSLLIDLQANERT